MELLIFAVVLAVLALVFLKSAVKIVPQQQVYVLEKLGKYSRTLEAGLHFIIPFIEVVRYRHSLKEISIDIPEQTCITTDNVTVHIDGVLFFQVMDPYKASYGVQNFSYSIIQLAQTTLRAEIGKMELDETLQKRDQINGSVVMEVDKATDAWGVKVLRYEVKRIDPPRSVLDDMEKQMRATREKRAQIELSIGERDSRINRAEGVKQETVKHSEAEKLRMVNEAEGQASAILAVANATAESIGKIAEAINAPGGSDAARLKVAEEYVKQFGELAKVNNTMIIPANTAEISSMMATAFSVLEQTKKVKA